MSLKGELTSTLHCRSKEDVEDVRREVQIMHHLKGHENIVTLIGTYEDKQSVHLVTYPPCRYACNPTVIQMMASQNF